MTTTSNSFAEALFMLAQEQNCVDMFFDDLKRVDKAFSENTEYTQLLSAPSVSKKDRLASINAAFKGNVSTHILSFLCLLCEKGKIAELPQIFADYQKLREFWGKTAVATVKSAVALDDAQRKKLVSVLCKRTGKNVILKTVIDKSVLGGLTVEIDGEVIDGTVKSNLKRVREVIGSE